MGKKFVVGLALLSFLIIPGIAGAAFFDGDPWYMGSSWWELITTDEDPSGVTTSLVDQDDRLEWLADSAWTTGDEAGKVYASKWVFELEDDFEFNVDFYYDHIGTFDSDDAGVMMGLYYFASGQIDPYTAGITAENITWWNEGAWESIRAYAPILDIPENDVAVWWQRTRNNGRLYASYDSDDDQLQMATLDKVVDDYTPVGGATFEGLAGYGVEQLGVYLGGWSEGASLVSGDAYLGNFQVSGGTITPEPLSSVLFLAGAASLAAIRLRKRKS